MQLASACRFRGNSLRLELFAFRFTSTECLQHHLRVSRYSPDILYQTLDLAGLPLGFAQTTSAMWSIHRSGVKRLVNAYSIMCNQALNILHNLLTDAEILRRLLVITDNVNLWVPTSTVPLLATNHWTTGTRSHSMASWSPRNRPYRFRSSSSLEYVHVFIDIRARKKQHAAP